jgi:hypothetical protein
VDQVIDQIDISSLLGTYKGGGTSSYDPRLMLKVNDGKEVKIEKIVVQ